MLLLTISLWKWNPSQLLIYSMKVKIYIGFWTLEMKCIEYGLYGQASFKNARSGQGRGARGSNFFGVAPTCHPDQCNARKGYLERPLYGLNPSLMIAYKYSSKHIPWCVKIIFQLPTINLFETTITIKNCNQRRWLSITFFISITMFCGTDNILWNIVNTTKYFYGIE
jgi:hypothetical protein